MDIDATRALLPVQFNKSSILAFKPKGARHRQDRLASVIYHQRVRDNGYGPLGERCAGAWVKGKTVDIYV
jgi:hypothetical protein